MAASSRTPYRLGPSLRFQFDSQGRDILPGNGFWVNSRYFALPAISQPVVAKYLRPLVGDAAASVPTAGPNDAREFCTKAVPRDVGESGWASVEPRPNDSRWNLGWNLGPRTDYGWLDKLTSLLQHQYRSVSTSPIQATAKRQFRHDLTPPNPLVTHYPTVIWWTPTNSSTMIFLALATRW